MLDLQTLPIDPNRLQARIDELGAIGTHPNGGLYRALYDDAWVEAMALLRRWMEAAGLSVRFDAVGNLWGRAEGTEGGTSIVTGS
ncbi:MAG: Zn-dependent hydrolase, partial [Chloroflexota bacterium]